MGLRHNHGLSSNNLVVLAGVTSHRHRAEARRIPLDFNHSWRMQ